MTDAGLFIAVALWAAANDHWWVMCLAMLLYVAECKAKP